MSSTCPGTPLVRRGVGVVAGPAGRRGARSGGKELVQFRPMTFQGGESLRREQNRRHVTDDEAIVRANDLTALLTHPVKEVRQRQWAGCVCRLRRANEQSLPLRVVRESGHDSRWGSFARSQDEMANDTGTGRSPGAPRRVPVTSERCERTNCHAPSWAPNPQKLGRRVPGYWLRPSGNPADARRAALRGCVDRNRSEGHNGGMDKGTSGG
jgi:hypothetical protein